MIILENGAPELSQYETRRYAITTTMCTHMTFWRSGGAGATMPVIETDNGYKARIPDNLIANYGYIEASATVDDGNGSADVVDTGRFYVRENAIPEHYAPDDYESPVYQGLYALIRSMQSRMDAGEFIGETGPVGPQGDPAPADLVVPAVNAYIAEYLRLHPEATIDEDIIRSAVNAWLANHPEYVTTVMDNSISAAKLTAAVRENVEAVHGLKQDLSHIKSNVYDLYKDARTTGNPLFLRNVLDGSEICFSSESQNVYTAGVNILPPLRVNVGISMSNGADIELYGSKSTAEYIAIDTDIKYYVCGISTGIYWFVYDSDKSYIGNFSNTTISENVFRKFPNAKYVRLRFDSSAQNEEIMLTVGEVLTEYTPSNFECRESSGMVKAIANVCYIWADDPITAVYTTNDQKSGKGSSDSHLINPKNYGAVGDGQTDDTDAFRHALAEGAGCIVVTDGVYRITGTLNVVRMDGIGTPTIISEADLLINMTGAQNRCRISNINMEGPRNGTGIKMDEVRNSIFDGVRLKGFAVGVLNTSRCWANTYRNCTFYNCGDGILGEDNTVNLETCNFYSCYFGANTNAIHANNIQNCHFFGGWMEENDNCILLELHGNIFDNTFTGVDFEINENILNLKNYNTSALCSFMFTSCSFVCNTTKRDTLVNHTSAAGTAYAYVNVDMNSCRTDVSFQLISSSSERMYLGVTGMNYRMMMHYPTPNSGYVCPCPVNASSLNYTVKEYQKTHTDDGIIVDFEDWVFVNNVSVSGNVDIKKISFFGIGSSITNVATTYNSDTDTTTGNIGMAIKRLYITRNGVDISSASVVVGIADFSAIT